MTTAARARARSIAIVVFSAVAIVALVLSLRANATQAGVSRREAARAVAEVERAHERLTAIVKADRESDCRILAIGIPKAGEPPPTTPLGQVREPKYLKEYQDRGCPAP